MLKQILTNWTTSLPGALIFICTTASLAELLPAEWYKYLMAFCGFMTALGFIAAKSSNVSNAPNPVQSHAVSDTRG